MRSPPLISVLTFDALAKPAMEKPERRSEQPKGLTDQRRQTSPSLASRVVLIMRHGWNQKQQQSEFFLGAKRVHFSTSRTKEATEIRRGFRPPLFLQLPGV
jgi:hypothetical protein